MAKNQLPSAAFAVILLLPLFLNVVVVHCKTLKRDVKALNEIKASLGWRVVYSWVGDDPCGDGDLPPWSGVTCSTQGDYRVVTELEVYAVSIVGPFPVAVTNLLDLTRLSDTYPSLSSYHVDLHNNKLTGPIPPQIGRLKRLKVLYGYLLPVWCLKRRLELLDYFSALCCRKEGLFERCNPRVLKNGGRRVEEQSTQVDFMRLQANHKRESIAALFATKDIPTTLTAHLYLSFNNFKGEIPTELANLPELRYLYLHENRFTGRIPPELGTLQNLRHLDVGNNHLVGTIRELIRIEGCFPSLRNLYLNNNYLTGGIPTQLANLTNLEILHLSYNKMTGIVPFGPAHIPRLTYLYLDHNQFSGRIPDAFYKHPFIKEMYIEGNAFRPGVNPIGFHKVLEVSDTEFLF
ncbi:hypothetical protein C3L33_14122, partial [Rhododendron williamsianum]